MHLIRLLISFVLLTYCSVVALPSLAGGTISNATLPATKPGNKLKLLSYNVWYGFTKKPDRKAGYLSFVKEQAPDIVSLQELNTYTPDKLAADANAWGHPHSVLLKEKGFPTGITSSQPITGIRRTLEGFHHGLLH